MLKQLRVCYKRRSGFETKIERPTLKNNPRCIFLKVLHQSATEWASIGSKQCSGGPDSSKQCSEGPGSSKQCSIALKVFDFPFLKNLRQAKKLLEAFFGENFSSHLPERSSIPVSVSALTCSGPKKYNDFFALAASRLGLFSFWFYWKGLFVLRPIAQWRQEFLHLCFVWN